MKKSFVGLFLLLLPVLSIAETVNWTGKIKWVNVKENDSAWVGLDNPSSPNPSGATWDCGSDIVWLGVRDTPASKNMLSVALTLYASQKSVRIGVRGSGSGCEAEYLSARE